MKAKEYANRVIDAYRIGDDLFRQEITKIANEFMAEIPALIKTRNAKTDQALFSILLELENKWKTYALRVNKELGGDIIRMDGFERLFELLFPDIHESYVIKKFTKSASSALTGEELT